MSHVLPKGVRADHKFAGCHRTEQSSACLWNVHGPSYEPPLCALLCAPAGQVTLLMNLVLLLWVLVGGYLVNPSSMPRALAWLRYTSPLSFAFEGLFANQVKGTHFLFNVGYWARGPIVGSGTGGQDAECRAVRDFARVCCSRDCRRGTAGTAGRGVRGTGEGLNWNRTYCIYCTYTHTSCPACTLTRVGGVLMTLAAGSASGCKCITCKAALPPNGGCIVFPAGPSGCGVRCHRGRGRGDLHVSTGPHARACRTGRCRTVRVLRLVRTAGAGPHVGVPGVQGPTKAARAAATPRRRGQNEWQQRKAAGQEHVALSGCGNEWWQ